MEPGNEADWALRGLCADCHRAVTQQQAAAARGVGASVAVARPVGLSRPDAASRAQPHPPASAADSGPLTRRLPHGGGRGASRVL